MRTLSLQTSDDLFFTADLHFHHTNVIRFCNRPFQTVEEMDLAMINNWNSKVSDNGIVFILGDFCFGYKKMWDHYLDRLKGEKILVLGNHDKLAGIGMKKFSMVTPLLNIKVFDKDASQNLQRITLCHYPMLSWYQSHHGAWQLFGHVHGKLSDSFLAQDGFNLDGKLTPRQLDVGVDPNNFFPLSYQDVKTKIALKTKFYEETKKTASLEAVLDTFD